MNVEIIENSLSLDNEYFIGVNGKKHYSVQGFWDHYDLFTRDSKRVLSIFKKVLTLSPAFDIYFNNEFSYKRQEALMFRTKSYFKNSFFLLWDSDIYTIYAHKDLKFSIYKNDIQIAGISQERWSILSQDNFSIDYNRDEDLEIIVAFTIILDLMYGNKKGSLISRNFGVWIEEKEYDLTWQPK
jgi:uncharacterized protein YxjI